MGANGLQKVEDINGEEGISPNNINPGIKESIEWSSKQLTMRARATKCIL